MEVNIPKQLLDAEVHHAGIWRRVSKAFKVYGLLDVPPIGTNLCGTPNCYQMTLLDQRVNNKSFLSFCCISVTYLFRPVDLIAVWLPNLEIQGHEISDVNNQTVLIGGQMAIFKWPYFTKGSIFKLYFLFTASM